MTELHHKPGFRAIVMAPDHLLDKWQREIEMTIPDAVVRRLTSWQDVLALRKERQMAVTHPTYYVIGRDRAKLSYFTAAVAKWDVRSPLGRQSKGLWRCPDCGAILLDPKEQVLWGKTAFTHPRLKNRWCPVCHGTSESAPQINRRPASGQGLLWSADGSRVRRVSPARLIRRYLKGFFDAVFADELHELKGESAQGAALQALVSVSRYAIGGTGTLNGGYASHQHYLGFRLHPWTMVKDGLQYRKPSLTTARYGRIERVMDTDDGAGGVTTHRSVSRERIKELPGVSPEFFARHLAERAVFIELADLGADALPPYEETIDWLTPIPEQAAAIRATIEPLRSAAIAGMHRGDRRLLGKLITFSLSYPDMPWGPPIPDSDGTPAVTPICLSQDTLYPKDQRLLAHIMAAVDGRKEKVWVYTVFTGTQLGRLQSIIEQHGYRVAVMTTAIPRSKREAWVDARLNEDVQVVISHPRLVETGLDLYRFPTMLWFQTGYSLFLLRQASRRAWRIGQTRPCKVVFLVYDDTMQEAALTLMGRKMEAALGLEGRLSLAGLQALGASDSSNDLARVLAEGLPQGTDASAIWQATPAEMAAIMEVKPTVTVPDSIPATPVASIPVIVVAARRSKKGRNAQSTEDATQGQLTWAF